MKKPSRKKELALLLAGSLIVLVPSFAKNGADDGIGESSGSSGVKIKGAFVPSVPDFAKGKLRYVEKPKHQRKELEIAVKIGIGALIDG